MYSNFKTLSLKLGSKVVPFWFAWQEEEEKRVSDNGNKNSHNYIYVSLGLQITTFKIKIC